METEQKIIKRLRQYKLQEPKPTYIIHFEECQLQFPSGKSSWPSLSAAKNALRNSVYGVGAPPEIKKLEEEGIIKYIKL